MKEENQTRKETEKKWKEFGEVIITTVKKMIGKRVEEKAKTSFGNKCKEVIEERNKVSIRIIPNITTTTKNR